MLYYTLKVSTDTVNILYIELVNIIYSNYSDKLLENHKLSLFELYERDKNRPSVIMWSVSNEPNTTNKNSLEYFK